VGKANQLKVKSSLRVRFYFLYELLAVLAAPTVNHMLSYGQAFDGLVLPSQMTHNRSLLTPPMLSLSILVARSDYKSERAGKFQFEIILNS
jgi:hypothetical protein